MLQILLLFRWELSVGCGFRAEHTPTVSVGIGDHDVFPAAAVGMYRRRGRGRRRGRLPRRTRSEVRTAGVCGRAKKNGCTENLREEAWNGWSSMKCTCSGRQSFNSSMEVLRYRHRTDVAQMLPREHWAGFFFFLFRLSRVQDSREQGNTRMLQHR